MKAKLYFLLLFLQGPLLLINQAFAQNQVQLTYSHAVAIGSPVSVSQDRNGNVYTIDTKHNLLRLDPQGRPLDTFSPPTRGRINAIEAWNPMKVLLFYQDRQELLLLDRFLRPINAIKLSALEYTGIAKAATLASDDGFWLFDESSFALQKFSNQTRALTVETSLNLILDKEQFDVRMIREYQNMVYLLDFNGGVYVFDNLGNYKKKLPFAGLKYISFKDDELYFVKDGKLQFYNLYTLAVRQIPLPTKKAYVSALVNDMQVFLFTPKLIEVFSW
ncbi:hypothetical protein ACFSKU_04820 [Pontibacter silvestris]|uniref:Uncharacterized protein n=1 Tax=Pontibacter silvestris TaxID=2305183 RepID=A0ABW4WWR1_9BACT|nr:hypothetical protein [Pontibacter silvestris]MCC9137300.1 hypothetical protein [Pontibacter silvestris]